MLARSMTSSGARPTLERLPRDAVPGVGAGGRRAGPLAQLRPGRGVGQQVRDRGAQRLRVLRRHEAPRRVRLHHVAEPAHVGEHHRLAEGQAGEQHPGHVDPPVGQDEHVGPAEERGQLEVAHVAGHEPDPPRRREAPQPLHRLPQRAPHHPQLRVHLPEGLEQHVHSLVGPHHSEAQHDGSLHGGEVGRERQLSRLVGQVLEGTVGDHPDPVLEARHRARRARPRPGGCAPPRRPCGRAGGARGVPRAGCCAGSGRAAGPGRAAGSRAGEAGTTGGGARRRLPRASGPGACPARARPASAPGARAAHPGPGAWPAGSSRGARSSPAGRPPARARTST